MTWTEIGVLVLLVDLAWRVGAGWRAAMRPKPVEPDYVKVEDLGREVERVIMDGLRSRGVKFRSGA